MADAMPDWEYGMSEVLQDGTTSFGFPVPTIAEARARVSMTRMNYPWPEEIGLARRRKAGPWEPVTEPTDDQVGGRDDL